MRTGVSVCVRLCTGALLAAASAAVVLAAPGVSLPTGWASRDIGSVGEAGSAFGAADVFIVTATGATIGGEADSFHYIYRRLDGDGEIVAQVSSLQYVHEWTQAGVMIRESLAPTSRHALVLVSAGRGVAFTSRSSTATLTSQATTTAAQNANDSGRESSRSATAPRRLPAAAGEAVLSGAARAAVRRDQTVRASTLAPAPSAAPAALEGAPHFVRLVRTGSMLHGYKSVDGAEWVPVGSDTIPMGRVVFVGLAVAGHAGKALTTATFQRVRVVERGDTQRSAAAPRPADAASPPAAAPSSTAAPPRPAPTPAPQPAPAPQQPAPQPSAPPAPPAPVQAPAPEPPPPPPPATQRTFRLLHWNVRHGGVGTDGRFDPDRVAAWVARMNPDVISLNEVDNATQAAMLHDKIAAYTGVSWTSNFAGAGNQILSRIPVRNSSLCHFNPSSNRRAPHMSLNINGRTVNIWAAHLTVDSASARMSEVHALQACARDWPEARILAGDYNMQQSSAEYAAAASGYHDAWPTARAMGTAYNYSGNCDGCTRNSRIDYVFSSTGASFLRVESAQIYDTRDADGHMPSDHKPLVVTYAVD